MSNPENRLQKLAQLANTSNAKVDKEDTRTATLKRLSQLAQGGTEPMQQEDITPPKVKSEEDIRREVAEQEKKDGVTAEQREAMSKRLSASTEAVRRGDYLNRDSEVMTRNLQSKFKNDAQQSLDESLEEYGTMMGINPIKNEPTKNEGVPIPYALPEEPKAKSKEWWQSGGLAEAVRQSHDKKSLEVGFLGKNVVKDPYAYADEVIDYMYASHLDAPDDAMITIDGERYTKEEFREAVAPTVYEQLVPWLWERSEKLRDDTMMAEYGMTYNQWERQRLTEIEQRVRALRSKAMRQAKDKIQPSGETQDGLVNLGADAYTEIAAKPFNDLLERIETAKTGGVLSAFDETFDIANLLTLGGAEIGNLANLYNISQKLSNGEELTENEAYYAELMALEEEFEGLRGAYGKATNTISQNTARMGGYVAQELPSFAVSMWLTGGSATALKSLGLGAARTNIRQSMREVSELGLKHKIKAGIRTGMEEGGEIILRAGSNFGKASVAGAKAATVSPTTIKSYMEKRNSQYQVTQGEDGEFSVTYTPRSRADDAMAAWLESYGEFTSEIYGVRIGDILAKGNKWLGQATGLNKLGGRYSPILRKVSEGNQAKWVGSAKRLTGYAGSIPAETVSEQYGTLLSESAKGALGLEYNLEELGEADTWISTFLVSGAMGVGFDILSNGKEVSNIADLTKLRNSAFGKIQSKELKAELKSISMGGNMEALAQYLASIEWQRYPKTDRAYAVDYVRRESALQVAMGDVQQTSRMAQLQGFTDIVEQATYRGANGEMPEDKIVEVEVTEDNDSKSVGYVRAGNYEAQGDEMLSIYDPQTGKVRPVISSKVKPLGVSTPKAMSERMYREVFANVDEQSRMANVKARYNTLRREDALTPQAVDRFYADMGIVKPKRGDKVTLVDGRTVKVADIFEDGSLCVKSKNPVTNKVETSYVPFYDILSGAQQTRMAQLSTYGENVVKTMEEAVATESAEIESEEQGVPMQESTSNEAMGVDVGVKVGDVIETPQGKVRVLRVDGEGNVAVTDKLEGEVDENDVLLMSAEEIRGEGAPTAEETPNTEAAETVSTETTPSAEEQAEAQKVIAEEAAEIEDIPTNEDGSVNFDAIQEPKRFAQLYESEVGSREQAETDVREMRDAVAEAIEAAEKQSKKVKSANEKAKLRKDIAGMRERVAFYDSVLAEMQPKVEPMQTAEVETPAMETQAEPVQTPTAEETPTPKKEDANTTATTKSGVLANEWSQKVDERQLKIVDEIAQEFGLAVVFEESVEDNGVKANALIEGRVVRIAYRDADKAIMFLVGHEFTHRMQDLSGEQYAKLKQSVKEYLGEASWKQRCEAMKGAYRAQGVKYTEELIEDEVVADFVGDLVEKEGVFDDYLDKVHKRGKYDRGFFAALRHCFAWMRNLFRKHKMDTRRIDNVLKQLDALIAESSKAWRDIDGEAESVTSLTDAASKGKIRLNIQTEESLQQKIRAFAQTREGKKAGWSKEQVESIIEETQALITAIDKAMRGNDFYDAFADREPTMRTDWRDGELKPVVTWSRANIEYKYDMSADLLCINNDGIEDVLSSPAMVALMKQLIPTKVKDASSGEMYDMQMTSSDYLLLYDVLQRNGFVVPCRGCFDAAGRFKMLPSVAQKFVADVNKVVDERNADPEKFDAKVRELVKEGSETSLEGLPVTAETKEMAIRVGVAGDKLTQHLDWYDFVTAMGQAKMLATYGGVFRAWQRTGAGRPKDKLPAEPYYGDITTGITTIIGKYGEKTPSYRDLSVNQGTGLRRNSHSEFRPVLAVDEIQFMRDAFIRGLTVFKYMKELDDVRIFGNMGVKYNMSYFPAFVKGTKAAGLDVDGNYVAAEESVGAREFPYTDANGKKHYDGERGLEEAKKYVNENVSLSSVVFSFPHLIKALTDVPTPSNKDGQWGSLIPFHSSGATTAQLAAQGLGMARANGQGHPFDESLTDYDKGVTNFEAIQNDRFGEGWTILAGKKKGQAVQYGHKIEFVNGAHYYNADRGVHLFKSGYVLEAELSDAERKSLTSGNKTAKNAVKDKHLHEFTVDYNDKVREIGTPYAYKEAADYYIRALGELGLVPRFDYRIPEDIFLKMCADANVDPLHPKLGWKGEGNGWSPTDAESYYSLFCDYGMTDPKTGEWSPHRPVGYINEQGEREFRLPDNVVDVVTKGLARYTEVRKREEAMEYAVVAEFADEMVERGRLTEAQVDTAMRETRFSLIGERGAANLDKAEEATIRLDSLAVAREMETAGKDAKAIKMATGWERGVDDLWRFEIPDVKIKRPDEWMGMRNIRLKDIVSGAEELFEAYPELADVKVKKGRGKGGGSYTHNNKTIELGVAHLKGWIDGLKNPSAYYSSYEEIEEGFLRQATYLRSTLIHEIQHAIQRIEGFASGGNSTMIIDPDAQARYDAMIESYNKRVEKYNGMSLSERRSDEGRDLANRLGQQRKGLDMFWKANSIGAKGYRRLAGEVEARNVEKRANMSMAERLASLAEETEDVAREDQIILREGVEMAMAKAKNKSADKTVSPNISDRSTAISSADGAKILKNLDKLARKYQEKPNRPQTFIGDVAEALGIYMPNKSSKYHTYQTIGGDIVTLRLSNHNAKAANLDAMGENEAVSIIVTNKPNEGLVNNGESHIVEFYYNSIKLGKAEGKPLVDIINSIKQTLYSGKYVDTTGLAEVQEINTKFSLREMDASYLDAVERGDMETAQRMVLEAAKRAGYTEEVYHGTPHFGFTIFRSHRPSGAIFTSTRRNVSANYAGDGNYASVRGINKGYKEPHSSEDIIENAKSVLEQDYHIAMPAEREAVIEKVEEEAKRVMHKMESLKEKAGEFPNDIADDIAWVENIIYSGATSRENGNEGDELSQMLKDDYDRFSESREALREYDKSALTDEQKAYLSFLTGYEVGDVAIDVAHSYANVVSSQDLATAGEAIVTMDWLADVTKRASDIGSYHLMGDLGANPLIIDAQGNAWYALDFNGMRDTDAIAEWAKDNGYTSVVFKNIYDYGDKSDVKVFFDSADLKSADPVTYDDNGNVIPLSERFNPKKEDIRYSMPSPESAIEAENIAILRNRAESMWAEPMDMEDAEKEEYILSETGWLHTDGGWMYLGAHSSLDDYNAIEEMRRQGVDVEKIVKTNLESKHLANKARIRKQYAEERRANREARRQATAERRAYVNNLRSNAAKVEYILNGTPEESLPFVIQALVRIATHRVHIAWDAPNEISEGLAQELGYSKKERKNYRQITDGAETSFGAYVHSWWEEIDGYSRDIDTQDLRNALIEALQEAPNANTALRILSERYDTMQQFDEADNLADYEERKALAAEEERYKQEVADFETSADKASYLASLSDEIRYHDNYEAMRRTLKKTVDDLAKARERFNKARLRAEQERENAERVTASGVRAVERSEQMIDDVMKVIAETKKVVLETIKGVYAIQVSNQELKSLIDKIGSARTIKDVEFVTHRAYNILLNCEMRKAKADLNKMLYLRVPSGEFIEAWAGKQVSAQKMSRQEAEALVREYFRPTNKRGVRIIKYLDDSTKNSMLFLRDKLLTPLMKRTYQQTKEVDELGNERVVRTLSPDLELSEGHIVAEISSNNERIEELYKKETLTSEEKAELTAREIYDEYLKVLPFKQEVAEYKKAIDKTKEEARVVAENGGSPYTQEYRAYMQTLHMNLYFAKQEYVAALKRVNEVLNNLMLEGRDNLKLFREQKEAHRNEVVALGLNAIGNPKRNREGLTAMDWVAAMNRITLNNAYWTFQTTLKEIDRHAPNGEGDFYRYFMYEAQRANDRYADMHREHLTELGEKIKRAFGLSAGMNPAMAIAEVMRKADEVSLGTMRIGQKADAFGNILESEEITFTLSNAMYLIAMWQQPRYQETLQRVGGIKQADIDNLMRKINAVNAGYLDVMEWVRDVLLPNTREEYNETHRKMFGAEMNAETNYFPARLVGVRKEEDVSGDKLNVKPSTMTGGIISRTNHGLMPDLRVNYFNILNAHLEEMDHWATYAPLIEDLNALLSNPEFKKRLNSYKSGLNKDRTGKGSLFELFRTTASIMVGAYEARTAILDGVGAKLQKGWATSNIAWRFNTALKQLTASPIFAGYAWDKRSIQLWYQNVWYGVHSPNELFAWALQSPSFAERWLSRTAGMEALQDVKRKDDQSHYADFNRATRGKAVAVAGNAYETLNKWLTKLASRWGMLPNAAVDAWVVATGMRGIYLYEMEKMTKGGTIEPTPEMEKMAMLKAEIAFNESQQSGEGAYLSQIQSERSLVTSGVTTYMNQSYAMHRLRTNAFNELWKQMTDEEYKLKMTKEQLVEARKKAYAQLGQGVTGDAVFQIVSGIGSLGLMSGLSYLLTGGDWDDDELEDNIKETLWNISMAVTIQYMPGVGLLTSLNKGFDTSLTPALSDLKKDIEKAFGREVWQANIDFSIYHAANLVAQYGYGVDLETFANILRGIENVIRDTKTSSVEGVMQILNMPKSQVDIVAGRRHEGETVMEYVDRRARIEMLFEAEDFDVNDIYDFEKYKYIGEDEEIGVRAYKLRENLKIANDKLYNGVIKKYFSEVEREAISEVDARYSSAMLLMGWSPTAKPKRGKLWEGDKWVAPATPDTYFDMYNKAVEVRKIQVQLDKWVGTDEGYAEMLRKQHELKKEVVNMYNNE